MVHRLGDRSVNHVHTWVRVVSEPYAIFRWMEFIQRCTCNNKVWRRSSLYMNTSSLSVNAITHSLGEHTLGRSRCTELQWYRDIHLVVFNYKVVSIRYGDFISPTYYLMLLWWETIASDMVISWLAISRNCFLEFNLPHRQQGRYDTWKYPRRQETIYIYYLHQVSVIQGQNINVATDTCWEQIVTALPKKCHFSRRTGGELVLDWCERLTTY